MAEDLQRTRKSCRSRAWDDAYQSFVRANQADPLGPDDLESMAVAAYLIDRDDDYLKTLERAHHARLDSGDPIRAARCAFWIGLRLLLRGEPGPATGWLARARRQLEGAEEDCAERGFLALPAAEQFLSAGDLQRAHDEATRAFELGQRFGDADLTAAAQHLLGRILVRQEQTEDGLAMLDEAMVAVTAGELSPIMTGLIYCSVIEACLQVRALRRARDWTSALARWCDDQPELVAFTATCRVHRAEIMQFDGSWEDAAAEAQQASERSVGSRRRKPPAAAFYQQAELHRLRGEFAAAEEGYDQASQRELDAQPGLALLRLAQGRSDAAVAAIQQIEDAATDRLQRVKLLPAYVEIMLNAGEHERAQQAVRELESLAQSFRTGVLAAIAAQARGAVELAAGNAEAALVSLRGSRQEWQELEAPYEIARVRVLMAVACRELGDGDGMMLELEAARATFRRLHAAPDLERIESLRGGARSGPVHGLSPRELEVLRLVASGETNKAIAQALHISEKTVARHLSNIFNKLGLSTRTAAAAYAYQHGLT